MYPRQHLFSFIATSGKQSTETAASLTLELNSNEATRQVYPFDFQLIFTYQLQGNSLKIHQKVINLSPEKMPFSIGFHPYFDRIGSHISQEDDAERLNIIISNAVRGQQRFLHLFSFEKYGKELVAGYSSLPSPVTGESSQQWVVLAISPLPQALAPLQQIWEAIFYLISGLLLAYLVAIVLIARDLARPLEKLRDYALTGFHGLHVTFGLVLILSVLWRSRQKDHYSSQLEA